MSDPIEWKTRDPKDCKHESNHVCEHGAIDHCRHGPIFCGWCGTNLTLEMEKDLVRTLRERNPYGLVERY